MTSTVVYTENLRTYCTHLQSSSSIETDAPVDNNGNGERFSPTDLLATSLASCMLTVMGIKARTMGYDLNDLKVEVEKIMKAEPRRVGGINLTYHVPDALKDLPAKDIAILKNVANTCPVQQSIHPDIAVNINWGAWANEKVVAS